MRINRSAVRIVAVFLTACSTLVAQPNLRQALRLNVSVAPQSPSGRALIQEREYSEKSVLLGIAYSLILPGLGDFYANKGETGKYYLGADVALWLTYGGFQAYGHWVKNDARTFAVEKADADFSGKGAQFEVDLGNFNDTDAYNQAKLRNRQYELLYDVASNYSWKWTLEEDRLRFKNERIRGDEVIRNSQFVVGALVINRIVAAISAARSVSEHNRNVQSLGGWRLKAEASGRLFAADGVVLTVSKTF
ncbi:MAG TPA: hypothetical protein DEP53_10405 [Bacteroidetes bacterium]|nr:hypothetical protein [Bacteroidota bacterium]